MAIFVHKRTPFTLSESLLVSIFHWLLMVARSFRLRLPGILPLWGRLQPKNRASGST